MRVSFLVDGFNLYHSLKDVRGARWLDLISFCKSYLPKINRAATLESVQYFSALVTHLQSRNRHAINRQRDFISCLEDSGVEVVLGRFKRKRVTSPWTPGNPQFRVRTRTHEEKETDVAIATHLIELLVNNTCDAAVLVTGDTDLAAGVKVAKRMFPQKEVFFLFPVGRKNDDLDKLVRQTFKATKVKISQPPVPQSIYAPKWHHNT